MSIKYTNTQRVYVKYTKVGLIRTTMWCGVNIVRTKYGAE